MLALLLLSGCEPPGTDENRAKAKKTIPPEIQRPPKSPALGAEAGPTVSQYQTIDEFHQWFKQARFANAIERQQAIWKAGLLFHKSGGLMDFLSSLPTGDYVNDAVTSLAFELIRNETDPLPWIEFSQQVAAKTRVAAWAETFFGKAVARIAELNPDPGVGLTTYNKAALTGSRWEQGLQTMLINYAFKGGPNSADGALLTVLQNMSADPRLATALSNLAVQRAMARSDWKGGMELLAAANPQAVQQAAGHYGGSIVRENSDRAAIAAELMPAVSGPSGVKSQVAKSFFSAWTASDMDEAMAWCDRQSAAIRDASIAAAYPFLMESNPEAARSWVTSIADAGLKSKLLREFK